MLKKINIFGLIIFDILYFKYLVYCILIWKIIPQNAKPACFSQILNFVIVYAPLMRMSFSFLRSLFYYFLNLSNESWSALSKNFIFGTIGIYSLKYLYILTTPLSYLTIFNGQRYVYISKLYGKVMYNLDLKLYICNIKRKCINISMYV